MSEATRFVVTGRVQGVGYRAFCLRSAGRLGLRGYARNLRDGTVVTVVLGPQSAILKYGALLRQGPGAARVDQVVESQISVEADRFKGFVIE